MQGITIKRLEELDVLRGLSVIGMILVITPGDWAMRFGWLNHAQWSGIVFADMIFPSFLFCLGFSLPISLKRRVESGCSNKQMIRHIIIRSTALILLGIVLNALPEFDWSTIRLPGVLQRIGLCWMMVSLLIYFTAIKSAEKKFLPNEYMLLLVAASILIAYWLLLAIVPVPGFGNMRFDSVGSWPVYIDRVVFGIKHMWPFGTTDGVISYDPEGLLATIPACVNVIIGALFACRHLSQKSLSLSKTAMLGCVLMLAGIIFSIVFPCVKKIWTSSFVLISASFSVFCLFGFQLLLNLSGKSSQRQNLLSVALQPLKVYGSNALFGFVFFMSLMVVLDKPFITTAAGMIGFREFGFTALQSVIVSPQWASFVFSILCLVIFYFVLLFLYKKSWFLKL